MGQTLTQKILASRAGRDEVAEGEIVTVTTDLVMGNELSSVLAIKEFEKSGAGEVFDRDKIALVADHFTPSKDIQTAEVVKRVKNFAKERGIDKYYDSGKGGIEHVILPDMGFVRPGMVIIGGDSHTCTYGAVGAFSTGVGSTDMAAAMVLGTTWMRVPETIKIVYRGKMGKWLSAKDLILAAIKELGVDGARYMAIEFSGDTIETMSMEGRFTICNMAVEMGAKNGMIEPDATTEEYIRNATDEPYEIFHPDPDARYARIVEIDVENMEPIVAFPSLPSNGRPVSEAEGIKMDQIVIGSCTNGRIGDLRIAADVLRGNTIHPDVRMVVIPGSQEVYLQAVAEGLATVFVESGAALSTPSCGPCIGGHLGVLASNEKCLSTTNRNFVGRMGDRTSEIYLCSPAVAAASAITGEITHPEKVAK